MEKTGYPNEAKEFILLRSERREPTRVERGCGQEEARGYERA
jgi:hypothetical protein